MSKETGFVMIDTQENKKKETMNVLNRVLKNNVNDEEFEKILTITEDGTMNFVPYDQLTENGTRMDRIKRLSHFFSAVDSQNHETEISKKDYTEMALALIKGMPAIYALDNIRTDGSISEQYERFCQFEYALQEYSNTLKTTNSYGMGALAFIEEMQKYFKKKDTKISALLVGSWTEHSFKEFQACVKYVYPNAETKVIDLFPTNNLKKESEKYFSQQNILKTNFSDKSFDIIQTDFLWNHLLGQSKDYLNEIYRILKLNGKYIGIESFLAIQEFAKNKGIFSKMEFKVYERQKTRQSVREFCRSSDGDIELLKKNTVSSDTLIVATK